MKTQSNSMTLLGGIALTAALLATGCSRTEPVSIEEPEPAAGSGAKGTLSVPDVAPGATVVEVDGTSLSEAEVSERVNRMMTARRLSALPSEQQAQARSTLRDNAIESFVAQTLLANEAGRRKLTADVAKIEETLTSIKAQIPEGLTFEQALQNVGLDEQKLRAQIERDLVINQLIESQMAGLPEVSTQQVAEFYTAEQSNFEQPESVNARHILVACEPTAADEVKAEKRALAEGYRKQLVDGADFAEMAKEHSEGPSSTSGGDLGNFTRGRMVPPFDEAAFAQEIGEIGEIVETQFGFHIIEVTAKQAAGLQSLDDVRDQIVSFLARKQQQEAAVAFIDGLKAKARITYAAGAAKPAIPTGSGTR